MKTEPMRCKKYECFC